MPKLTANATEKSKAVGSCEIVVTGSFWLFSALKTANFALRLRDSLKNLIDSTLRLTDSAWNL